MKRKPCPLCKGPMERVRYSAFPAHLCLDESCGCIDAPRATHLVLNVVRALSPRPGWLFTAYRGPDLGMVWLFVLTILAAVLAASVAKAQPAPPCPIEAPALARLRSEHAAMNAAGLACLATLDAARAERDRCHAAADAALDDLARDLAEASAALDAAQAALAAPVPEHAPGRPWALVGLGGLAAAGAAGAAVAFDAGALEATGAGIGAALVAAGVVAAVAWALD